jgi:hypothetical protein
VVSSEQDGFREDLVSRYVGRAMTSSGGATEAPDEVNVPMIRHWVAALDDRNPIYLDEAAAKRSRFGHLVAPPAMLQVWTFPPPTIEGIAERGGAPGEMDPDSALVKLDEAGYVGTLATNSELQFDRYLAIGERLHSTTELTDISELKGTGLGAGYFVTWVNTYFVESGEEVGRQIFRVLKFKPGEPGPKSTGTKPPRSAPVEPTGEKLPDFDLNVTATVIVAGAIASRDFMPVHHDKDYAQAQFAPDIFMNILTTNGYVARYITDWAGPEARIERIDVKLGAPAVPDKVLRFTGQVIAEEVRGADGDAGSGGDASGERVIDVAVNAANDLGNHATGTVRLTLPL